MSNQIVISSGAKVRELEGVLTGTSGVVNSLPINASNGIPQLDVNGKILVSQLPNSVMEYQGVWNANTNTPTLTNGGAFNQGDVYLCNVAGTTNFGAGPISFIVGDQAIFSSVAEGSIWQKAGGASGTVTSVAITESGDSLNITGSPITTSGTINIGFNGTNLQYINGAGNLTTFPILTGYVPYTGATANVNIGTHSFIANDGTYNTEMSPSLFGVENATGLIFGLLEYNKLTLTNNTGVASVMEVNAQGLIFPDASVQTSSYTDAKARLALSLTTTGTSGVATYNNTTGVFNIPNYGSALSGYVPYTGATSDVDLDTFKLNAQSIHAKGTGGLGHFGMKHQSASATASANEVSLFADSLGDFSWLNGNLYLSKFITSGNTAARSYTFPNANGTVALTSDLTNYVDLTTAQTIGGTKTFSDATKNNGGIFLQNASSNSLAGYMNIGGLTNGVKFTSGGGVSNSFTLPSATGYTFTFDAITGTIAMLEGTQTFSGYKTFSSAISANAGIAFLNGVMPPITSSYYSGIGGNSQGISIVTRPVSTNYTNNLYFAASNNSFTFPNATGTIALTSDLTGGTVTSVAALTIGTSGTDLSSTVANSTTTPVITLNVPTASATNRGALSSADWTTFNSKQGTITLTTTGTSGAATFSANTLNIPNYAPDLSGYVTLATTQTISGAKTFTSALNGTKFAFSSSSNSDWAGAIDNLGTTGANGLYVNIGASSTGTPFAVYKNFSQLFKVANDGAVIFSGNVQLLNDNYVYGNATSGSGTIRAGIRFNSTDQELKFFTADAGRMTLNASGNLGLGVTPSAWGAITALELANGVSIASYSAAAIPNLYLTNNAFYNGSNWIYKVSSFAATMQTQTSGGNYAWNIAPSGTAGAAITFTQAMTLTAAGNLGIGTTSAYARLHSAFTANGYDASLTYNSQSAAIIENWGVQLSMAVHTTDGQPFYLQARQSANISWPLALNPVGGNVLIGTTTDAGYKLDVNGTGRFSGALTATGAITTNSNFINSGPVYSTTGNVGNLLFTNTYPSNYNVAQIASVLDGYYYAAKLVFRTADQYNANLLVDRLTIASTGAATFSSSVTATGFTVGEVSITSNQIYRNSANEFYVNYSGTGNTILGNGTGNVSINAGTNPSYRLQVGGTLGVSGAATFSSSVTATSFFESSSIKGKDIIATNPLLALDIDVIKYTRKSDESKDIRYGYSAEQIHSLMPELTDKDVTAVKYLDVHTILIANLQKEIRELKAKLNN